MLFEQLTIEKGITVFVGGGGKTTAIFRSARELTQRGEQALICTTTHIRRPKGVSIVLGEDAERLRQALNRDGWAVAADRQEGGKLAGVSPRILEAFRGAYVLAEGDGAREMPCKVPAEHEPVIPQMAGHVIAVFGASALGRPFGEVCFRGERWPVSPQEPLTPRLAAELLTSELGGRKGVGERRFTIFINQADANPALARETGQEIERRGRFHVVIASAGREEPC